MSDDWGRIRKEEILTLSRYYSGTTLKRLQKISLVSIIRIDLLIDHLCGGVPGYRSRGPGFDSLGYQIF
jgi:hypothetical protein